MEFHATKKGAKKLVSSNVAKILEKKKVAIKIRETCEKAMFTPSNQLKLHEVLLLLLSNKDVAKSPI